MLGRARVSLDPRDMKAAYVVSDENGYYDSQNIVCVRQAQLATSILVEPSFFGGSLFTAYSKVCN